MALSRQRVRKASNGPVQCACVSMSLGGQLASSFVICLHFLNKHVPHAQMIVTVCDCPHMVRSLQARLRRPMLQLVGLKGVAVECRSQKVLGRQ